MTTQDAKTVLDPAALTKIRELMRLHDEAMWHWMKLDGMCKSSEGTVTVYLTNSFERDEGENPLRVKGIEVFAYVVGPSRHHYFDTVDEALAVVRQWHVDTMAVDIEERRREEEEGWVAWAEAQQRGGAG